MQMLRLLLTALLVLLIPPHLGADDSHMVDLSGLRGTHSQKSGFVEVPIDAGRAFSSIQSVRLHIEGSARPGEVNAQESSAERVRLPLSVHLKLADNFRNAVNLNSPVAGFGPVELSFTEEPEFYGKVKSADWSFLHDGRATLRFSWAADCPGPCRYVEYPSVDVYDAYMLIEGVLAD